MNKQRFESDVPNRFGHRIIKISSVLQNGSLGEETLANLLSSWAVAGLNCATRSEGETHRFYNMYITEGKSQENENDTLEAKVALILADLRRQLLRKVVRPGDVEPLHNVNYLEKKHGGKLALIDPQDFQDSHERIVPAYCRNLKTALIKDCILKGDATYKIDIEPGKGYDNPEVLTEHVMKMINDRSSSVSFEMVRQRFESQYGSFYTTYLREYYDENYEDMNNITFNITADGTRALLFSLGYLEKDLGEKPAKGNIPSERQTVQGVSSWSSKPQRALEVAPLVKMKALPNSHISSTERDSGSFDVTSAFENPTVSGKLEPFSFIRVNYKNDKPQNIEGLYDHYVVGPVIGDGNCFFHAVFTQRGQTRSAVDVFAADLRSQLQTVVMSHPPHIDIMRREVLADTRAAFIKGAKKTALEGLYKKLEHNLDHEKAREYVRNGMAEDLSQLMHNKSHQSLSKEKRDFVETQVLEQLPECIKEREHFKDEELLREIPDDIVSQYLTRYRSNTGDSSCYIEIPVGTGELSSIAVVIAESQNMFVNCFLYDAQAGELNYKGSFGNKIDKSTANILYNGMHFWALFNEGESSARRKGIYQAAENALSTSMFNLMPQTSTSSSTVLSPASFSGTSF